MISCNHEKVNEKMHHSEVRKCVRKHKQTHTHKHARTHTPGFCPIDRHVIHLVDQDNQMLHSGGLCKHSMLSGKKQEVKNHSKISPRLSASITFFRLPTRVLLLTIDLLLCNAIGSLLSTVWCSEIGSLTSLNACNSGASSDVREPISLHQAVLSYLIEEYQYFPREKKSIQSSFILKIQNISYAYYFRLSHICTSITLDSYLTTYIPQAVNNGR